MVLFDTLRASQRLQQAGFEAPKADAIVTTFAEDISERIATRDDIDEVRGEIEQLRIATQRDIEQLRTDMERGFGEVRGEIEQLRTATRRDIEQLRTDMERGFGEVRGDLIQGDAQTRSELRAEMREMEARLIRWMVGTALAAVGAGAALATAVILLLS